MNKPYTRLLLKISGEQLSGKYDVGVDMDIANYLAQEIKKVHEAGCQIVIVAGGGNMVRGAEVTGQGVKRVTGDQMGMLSGLINSMFLTDVFESKGIETRCLSNIYAAQVAESYSYKRATKHLESGRVLVVAGGLARPYFTHDTAAVSFALELDCQAVLKATKFDGVYDKDPAIHKDAKKVDSMSFGEALSNDAIQVMDKAGVGLAMEQGMPVIVFDVMVAGNLLKVAQGHSIGTLIARS